MLNYRKKIKSMDNCLIKSLLVANNNSKSQINIKK